MDFSHKWNKTSSRPDRWLSIILSSKTASIDEDEEDEKCEEKNRESVLYKLPVHTIILERSPHFATMLDSNFAESNQNEIIELKVANRSEGRALYVMLFALYTNDVFGSETKDSSSQHEFHYDEKQTHVETEINGDASHLFHPVKDPTSVVSSLSAAEFITLIRCADFYQVLHIIIPLLPSLRPALSMCPRIISDIYALPQIIQQHVAMESLCEQTRLELLTHFKEFYACWKSKYYKFWISLPAPAILEVVSCVDIEIDNEITVLHAVCKWMEVRWEECGGKSSEACMKKMFSTEIVDSHSEILQAIQWFQLPKEYLLHVILPLFDVGNTLSHVPLFRTVLIDVCDDESRKQNNACSHFIHDESECLRDLYPEMNLRRVRKVFHESHEIAFTGVNALAPFVNNDAISDSYQSSDTLCFHGMELRCTMFFAKNSKGKSQMYHILIPTKPNPLHYSAKCKIRTIIVWNFRANSYEALWETQKNENFYTIPVSKPTLICAESSAVNEQQASMSTARLIERNRHVRNGHMKFRFEILHD